MNSQRRVIDKNSGKTFIPMNVEGGQYDEHFINTTKTAVIILMALGLFVIVSYVQKMHLTVQGNIIVGIGVFLVYSLIIRYIIFEERYYYRMYNKMKLYKNPTAAVFWNITSIQETDEGAILNYGDGKIGVVLKLNRDTIVGKDPEFQEIHFDAISDFNKQLNQKGYFRVHANIMEQAGKDPRLAKMDNVVHKPDNKNIRLILEQELGHIKRITRATLFECDYYLIYTKDLGRLDVIMDDVVDAAYTILDGAYVDYSILTKAEVIEMHSELQNVGYFDYADAAMNTFKSNGVAMGKAMDLVSVKFNSGVEKEIGSNEISRLKYLSSCIDNGSISYGEWSIYDTLGGVVNKEKDNVKKVVNNKWSVDSSKLLDLEDETSRFENSSKETKDVADFNSKAEYDYDEDGDDDKIDF